MYCPASSEAPVGSLARPPAPTSNSFLTAVTRPFYSSARFRCPVRGKSNARAGARGHRYPLLRRSARLLPAFRLRLRPCSLAQRYNWPSLTSYKKALAMHCKVFCLFVLACALGGCMSSGNESIADATNATVSGQLLKGKTNQTDVRRIYGDPIKTSFSSNGFETWV